VRLISRWLHLRSMQPAPVSIYPSQTEPMSIAVTPPVLVSEKDWVVTLVLAVVLGFLGIDRFYAGSIGLGVLKLLTSGGLGLWWLIDIILLATGNYRDGNGHTIATK